MTYNNMNGLAGGAWKNYYSPSQINDIMGSSSYTGAQKTAFTNGLGASTDDLLKYSKGSGDNSILGLSGGQWDTIGNIGSLVGGAFDTFAGLEQLGLARNAFNFDKGMKQKEYAMAKDAYDKNVARAKSIGDQMNAGKVA